MNHPMNDSSTESAIWLDLVGANQGWLKRCRAAASGNPTALAELTDDSSPAARALQTGDTRTARPPTEDPLAAPPISYDWQVAANIRSLTRALVGQLDARDGVAAAFRIAHQANLVSDAEIPPTPGPTASTDEDGDPTGIGDAVTRVMQEIRRRRHDRARPFVELLALDLTGHFPTTVDTVTVPVVFAGDTRDAVGLGATGVGATGKLILELSSNGPPPASTPIRAICAFSAPTVDSRPASAKHGPVRHRASRPRASLGRSVSALTRPNQLPASAAAHSRPPSPSHSPNSPHTNGSGAAFNRATSTLAVRLPPPSPTTPERSPESRDSTERWRPRPTRDFV